MAKIFDFYKCMRIVEDSIPLNIKEQKEIQNALSEIKEIYDSLEYEYTSTVDTVKKYKFKIYDPLEQWAIKEIWKLRDNNIPFSEEYTDSFLNELRKQMEIHNKIHNNE